jgi:hypothetical protein
VQQDGVISYLTCLAFLPSPAGCVRCVLLYTEHCDDDDVLREILIFPYEKKGQAESRYNFLIYAF